MISDLENLVISYLDPDSYKILQQYNPKKYNKLSKIQTQYEKIIPDIIKLSILKTAPILKGAIVIGFGAIDDLQKFSSLQKEILYKIQQLITYWFYLRVDELIAEYKKLDLNLVGRYDISIFSKVRIYLSGLHNFTIVYGSRVLTPDLLKEYKAEVYSLQSLAEIKKLIADNSFSKVEQYINSLQYPFTQENKDKIIECINFNNLELTYKFINEVMIQALDDFDFGYDHCLQSIAITDKYYQTKLLEFTDFDPQLMMYLDCRGDKETIFPVNFRQSLYNIMETVDQFIRIYNNYFKIVYLLIKNTDEI